MASHISKASSLSTDRVIIRPIERIRSVTSSQLRSLLILESRGFLPRLRRHSCNCEVQAETSFASLDRRRGQPTCSHTRLLASRLDHVFLMQVQAQSNISSKITRSLFGNRVVFPKVQNAQNHRVLEVEEVVVPGYC